MAQGTKIIKNMQQGAFVTELGQIKSGMKLSKGSCLSKLNPVINANRILRVGGRLGRAELSVEEGHPMILPGSNHITCLIVRHHHLGRVWERMIGITRRILDSMLLELASKRLTHEVLSTLMAEVSAFVNSRPLVSVSNDPVPEIFTPATLLTQKLTILTTTPGQFTSKDLHTAQLAASSVFSPCVLVSVAKGILIDATTEKED